MPNTRGRADRGISLRKSKTCNICKTRFKTRKLMKECSECNKQVEELYIGYIRDEPEAENRCIDCILNGKDSEKINTFWIVK